LFTALSLRGQDKLSYNPYVPIKFKKNIDLRGFEEIETYKLSDEEFVLIGEKKVSFTQGLRLYYLKKIEERFRVLFSTHGQGESYYFNPYFYKTEAGHRLVIAEIGTEYSWGVHVYSIQDSGMIDVGFLNLAGTEPPENYPASILRQMDIYQRDSETLFEFRGTVLLQPGQIEQKQRNGRKFYYIFDGKSLELVER
jgi:hypothetical protein